MLFEAKLYSGFGEESEDNDAQLVRELEGGLAMAESLGTIRSPWYLRGSFILYI